MRVALRGGEVIEKAHLQTEQIQQLPIDELHPFVNHPFKVQDDEAMAETVESISQRGILSPLIARPRAEGGYEIISGHRRQYAAKKAGLDTVPVIVRNMTDDDAIILLVDSNIQRENILPSERAFAFKMKMDALAIIPNAGKRRTQPMADNRKYYYLKLKESYFDDDAIVLLESMQDGVIYSNILLKLYLKSLKNGGKLQLDENIPYTAQMIATITRQQVGTVERALKIFMKLGLVEPLPSGALYMSNIELLIGQSSTEGERKRRARLALQEQKALPQTGADKCPPYRADICPPEIEIEKEIDIEIEKERELETGHPAPAAYGRYHNVILSDTELDGLKTELPGKWEYYIDRLSCHIASSGRKYKSHAATIFKWAQEDAAKKAPKKGIPDYTCKEGESL